MACCHSLRPVSAAAECRQVDSCERFTSRFSCEAHFLHQRVPCGWVADSCVPASTADCREAFRDLNYYGETTAFKTVCGPRDTASPCTNLSKALEKYARRHSRATLKLNLPGGIQASRVLVIRDRWQNVGMGFIPFHVSDVIKFALWSGIYVYFENYGRYDWQKYFYGYGGLDTRWTAARQSLWESRFANMNASKQTIDVINEVTRKGDEEWETTLLNALVDPLKKFITLNGQATTISWQRVFALAMKKIPDSEHALIPRNLPGDCSHCTFWANFRPRRVLRSLLVDSPIGRNQPLVCLKARTMYAEDKRYFPDNLDMNLEAADQLWASYNGKWGDLGFWGPRPRLRCRQKGENASTIVLPSKAVKCMNDIREYIGPQTRIFVAVDAPRFQRILLEELGTVSYITPGVGVDPTNEYRDVVNRETRAYASQELGAQDLAEQNLIKVSLDFFIQGFCVAAMTLRPSAFYHAATTRTESFRHIMVANATASSGRTLRGCAARVQTPTISSVSLCRWERCNYRSCNQDQ